MATKKTRGNHPPIENGIEQKDAGTIVVRPAYVKEVDMSTSTIQLPSIKGVKMQNYDLEGVGTDLAIDDETRTPTGPLPATNDQQATDSTVPGKKQRGKAAKGGENPDAAKPAKPTPEPFHVEQWHGDTDTVCTLSDLMPLDETGLPASTEAMREIARFNVDNLKRAYRETPKAVPAIGVVWSNREKFVPYDGNHRWAALSEIIMEDLGLDPTAKTSASDPRYVEELPKTLINIEVTNEYNGHPVTNRDLIEMAFTANFKHGMMASEYGRTAYAIWWMVDYVERNGKTYHGIQKDACRVAGVEPSALSKALSRQRDKLAKRMKQPVDFDFLPEEDKAELDAQVTRSDRQSAEDILRQACKRLISTAKALNELFESGDTAHAYIAQFVENDNDVDALSNLSDILSYGFEAPEKTRETANA